MKVSLAPPVWHRQHGYGSPFAPTSGRGGRPRGCGRCWGADGDDLRSFFDVGPSPAALYCLPALGKGRQINCFPYLQRYTPLAPPHGGVPVPCSPQAGKSSEPYVTGGHWQAERSRRACNEGGRCNSLHRGSTCPSCLFSSCGSPLARAVANSESPTRFCGSDRWVEPIFAEHRLAQGCFEHLVSLPRGDEGAAQHQTSCGPAEKKQREK